VARVHDIVGPNLNPPGHAMALCVDEKSRTQALERTQPLLPLGLGYVERVTHDYVRPGTTTLFAALDLASGQQVSRCSPRHHRTTALSHPLHTTYSSWLNQVEIWFNNFTQTAIRRGSLSSVRVDEIRRFAEAHNPEAVPFMWTATADSIIQKTQRLCHAISGSGH
jgi:putative transposase